MSVVLAIEDIGPCKKRLKIGVPVPAVEAETERVTNEYARQARIPGFRKGKVPLPLLKKKFAHDIEHEVIDRLLPRYWKQAEAESQVDPLLPPQVEDVHMHAGEGLHFTATVEVRPTIELRNVKDFELPEMALEPTPEEVDHALDDLRRGAADWVEIERPIAQGDGVTAMLTETSTENTQPGPVAFEVGDQNVWDELSLAATGLKKGQNGDFTRKEGEGAEAVERRFKMEIVDARERKLPELDDAFAKKVGNFADVGALKEEVRARIAAAKRNDRRRRRESAVLDQLRDRHPLSLPEGVVEHEQEHLLREYAESLAERGVDPEKAEVDWQALAGQIKPQAEKRVHARLLLDAIAEAQGVTVSEDEFERTISSIARGEGKSPGAVRQALDEAGRLQTLRAQLRREKALQGLTGDAA